jgi:glycosyltransferase involved in cell wall biosynthesis
MLRRRRPGPLPVTAPSALLEYLREGAAPLEHRPAGDALRIAIVIPSFRRGSGGHSTIANLVRELEAAGHDCSLWLEDAPGLDPALFNDFFGPVRAHVHGDFDAWQGADVAVATGWQTVHRALRLPGCAARAYLVQDHEPEFYGTSAERTWAEETYGLGLHCVCASRWLAGLVAERYGASASHFDLGVDHDAYRPLAGVERSGDRVLFYARAVTPRRAVPLGVLALQELRRRRPGVEIALFGEAREVATPFEHEHLGVLDSRALAREYARSAAGLVLSMTNPSLVPTEMLACGLPVVDVASDAMVAEFGGSEAVELAAFDPLAIAGALERLLDDRSLRARRSDAGTALVAARTWRNAAAQVEAGIRQALTGDRATFPAR